MDFFSEAFIKPYTTKFMMLSFSNLIKKYYECEKEIETDLVNVVGYCLLQKGYQFNDGLYRKSNSFFAINFEFSSINRCFRVNIEESGVPLSDTFVEIPINHLVL